MERVNASQEENSGDMPSLAQPGSPRHGMRLAWLNVRGMAECTMTAVAPGRENRRATPRSLHYDVVAFGELVVDLVPARGATGEMFFAPKPGGAPGNVAVGVARLGGRSAMLIKVGDDAFGKLLIATLVHHGVATEGVLRTREGNTSLAVVTVAADGERDFTLYRKGCAESTFGPRRSRLTSSAARASCTSAACCLASRFPARRNAMPCEPRVRRVF